MNLLVLSFFSLWFLSSIGGSWLVSKTSQYTAGPKLMLNIVAWVIPIIGGFVVYVTLHSRGQLAWQNRNLEHAVESLAEYGDKPDMGGDEH